MIASSVYIENSQVIDNTATLGGALKAFPNTSLSIWKTKFTRNKTQQGGAIYSMEAKVFLMENLYSYNTARSYLGRGGAISLLGGTVVIHFSQFNNNRVNYGGGALFSI